MVAASNSDAEFAGGRFAAATQNAAENGRSGQARCGDLLTKGDDLGTHL
jgi:hypothetical protein